jgi:hypothetical protein
MNWIIITIITASCLFAGNAFSADWKFYGGFTSAQDTQELLFYDADSVTNSNNSIKLWVKISLYKDIEKCLDNKSVIENAAKKMANGYIAPITKISPKTLNAAYLEEAANEPAIKSKAEILFQIACNENRFRRISQLTFNKAGVLDQRLGINNWENIEPESNADNLAKILCVSK